MAVVWDLFEKEFFASQSMFDNLTLTQLVVRYETNIFVLADPVKEILSLEDALYTFQHLIVRQEVQLAEARIRTQVQTIVALRPTEQLFVR